MLYLKMLQYVPEKANSKNIGDQSKREFNLLMRRNYFVDFEVVVHHRKELIQHNLIDLYVSDSEVTYAMTDGRHFRQY